MNNFEIVVPTYNRLESLLKCLDSLIESTSYCKDNFLITCVVNDSFEYKYSILKNPNLLRKYHQINFVKGSSRIYWSRSIYLGVYPKNTTKNIVGVFLVNDDTVVDNTTFYEFTNSDLDKVKVCRVDSSVQKEIHDYQSFRVKRSNFSISPIVDEINLDQTNAIACRFSYFPVEVFANLNWVFMYFMPQYLGDLYISYSAYRKGLIFKFVTNTRVQSLDRIFDLNPKYTNFFSRRFKLRSPENILALSFFWLFVLFLKS